MTRRGVLPIVLLLALALFVVAVQLVPAPASAPKAATATPTPVASPMTGAAGEVAAALSAVQRAYDAGDVVRLCRPGSLLDPAVVKLLDSGPEGCEGDLETLMGNVPQLRVSVRSVSLRPDLATASVTTTSGATAPVDLVRSGRHTWLVSFSEAGDPMPVLAGTS